MTNNTEDKNFDMQELKNMTGQTLMSVNNLASQMGVLAGAVNGLKTDVYGIKDRLDTLEQQEEVKTEQATMINLTAQKRIYEILQTKDDQAKYYRKFIAKLYSDSRKYAGMGNQYQTTKKCNYQRVIDYMESWRPSCGIAEFKRQCDEKAKAKRKAKELGYDC